jgi:hypothetical protein
VTGSGSRRSSKKEPPALPSLRPLSLIALETAFRPYRQAISTMSSPELLVELTRINAALEVEARERLSAAVSFSESRSSIDDPVLHSGPTATPYSERRSDRGQARSPSPLPTPAELRVRAGGGRMGPRLAARLVAAETRRQTRRGSER